MERSNGLILLIKKSFLRRHWYRKKLKADRYSDETYPPGLLSLFGVTLARLHHSVQTHPPVTEP